MIVYPAIDIKSGQVVRLRQGDPHQKTVYGQNPLEVALEWQAQGAQWVHIVNLDGALDEKADLWSMLSDVAQSGLNVQFGGGLRTSDDIQRAVDSGIQRAVIGTAAVENPDLVSDLITRHGADKIVVALDARGDKVSIRGWQQETDWTTVDLGRAMVERGVQHALYTDIMRDGQLEGVNVAATIALAEATGLQVVASGGVRSIQDVEALAGKVAGVILGKALYEKQIDLAEALQRANPSPY